MQRLRDCHSPSPTSVQALRFSAVPARDKARSHKTRASPTQTTQPLGRQANAGIRFQQIKTAAEHTQHLWQLADLFGDCFYDDDDSYGSVLERKRFSALERLTFSWQAVLYLVSQHLAYPDAHVTILAWADPISEQHQPESSSTADGISKMDVAGQASSRSPSATGKRQLVGMVSVTLDQAVGDLPAALNMRKKSPYALLANLGVSPGFRRRGLALQLIAQSEKAANQWRLTMPLLKYMCLLVARPNVGALRLYDTAGYLRNDVWIDGRWKRDAEMGRLGKPRRLLYVKQLGL